MSDKTHMHGSGESYSGIVPTKQSNEGGRPPNGDCGGKAADQGERGRAQPVPDTEPGNGPSGLDRVRAGSKKDRKLKFTALLHHVNIDLLRSSYYSLKKQAAAGVDGVTWEEYGGDLEEVERPARTNPSRGLSSATVAKSLDTETRWKATTIGNRGAGRQNRPARGGERFSTKSGKRTFWVSRTDSGRGAASTMHWTRCTSESRARR